MTTTNKLICLIPELGEYGVLPDNSILNIAGVEGPTFTVGGKGIVLSDGTSSDGSISNFLEPTFQNVYNFSNTKAIIKFSSNKDLIFEATNTKQFKFNSITGDVTIGGNLTVIGSSTNVVNTQYNTDKIVLNQTSGNYVPLVIEPIAGVTQSVNLLEVRSQHSALPVVSIDSTGQLFVNKLNAISINNLNIADINSHLSSTGIKHSAAQISVSPKNGVVGSNVQDVIEDLSVKVNHITSGTTRGIEYLRTVPDTKWSVPHNQNSKKLQVTVWGASDEMLFVDSVKIVDNNNIEINFSSAIIGRAILIFFD